MPDYRTNLLVSLGRRSSPAVAYGKFMSNRGYNSLPVLGPHISDFLRLKARIAELVNNPRFKRKEAKQGMPVEWQNILDQINSLPN